MSRPRWRGSKPAQREKHRRAQGNRCGICTRELNGTVEVDHILPRSAGGPDTWHNLHLVHRYCNIRKNVSPLAAVRAQLTLFDEQILLSMSPVLDLAAVRAQLTLFDEPEYAVSA